MINFYTMNAIKRSAGHTAVEKVAYNSCSKINDHRTGQTHNYTKKQGHILSEIVIPENGKEYNRETLWNYYESLEKRKDACLGRTITFSLPVELNQEQRINLTREYSQLLSDKFSGYVDFSIHESVNKKTKKFNPHAHLTLTDRNKDGQKIREFSDKKMGAVEQMRKDFETTVNKYLEKYAPHAPPFQAMKSEEVKDSSEIATARKNIEKLQGKQSQAQEKLKFLQRELFLENMARKASKLALYFNPKTKPKPLKMEVVPKCQNQQQMTHTAPQNTCNAMSMSH